ncbi:MAG: chemotaxis protein CheD [Nitrospiraceae bacterium]|nr:chemotaxis protein CheD [Nitrospiraceae bacterium]
MDRPVIPDKYLMAGEFYFSLGPARVITVLGSCVSITMFNERLGIGAICHALLPGNSGAGDDFRYVDTSIARMIREFEKLKISRSEIEVKLFGGADMFQAKTGKRSLLPSVGQQNVKTALRVIEKEKLQLRSSDVGGRSGRKLYYHTHTNVVYIKLLNGLKA